MPLKNQTTVLTSIEEELKVLKEFTENKEKESLSLSKLIGSDKAKKLLKKTPKLQKILRIDEGLEIRRAIIDLFPEIKNKPLLKKILNDAKEDFEKTDAKNKTKKISTHKTDLENDNQTVYIYLRILHRQDSIANLAKFKQLIDLATSEDNIKIIVDHLQKKFSAMGLKGLITFNNLNTLSDWHCELEEIKKELPKRKLPTTPSNISITPSEENFSAAQAKENISLSSLAITTSKTTEHEQDAEFLPSWETLAKQQQHIISLEKALEFLSKEDNLLRSEKDSLEKEVTRLQDIGERLEFEKSLNNSRNNVLNVLHGLKLPNINELSKENQSLKEGKQKIETTLIENETRLTEISNKKTESDNQLLEAKKSLEEAKNTSFQKNFELKNIATQLQATEQKVSEFKSLQSDLNSANDEITQLKSTKNFLQDEINKFQNLNQKLSTELQENLIQKTELENKLKTFEGIIRSYKSANQEILNPHALKTEELTNKLEKQINEIQELTLQILENNNIVAEKEKQIKDLTQTSEKIQEKFEELKNKSCQLEQQARKDQQEIAQLINAATLSRRIEELTKEQIALTEQSNFNQEELCKQIATLKESSKKSEQAIPALEEEKESQKNYIQDLESKIEKKDKEIKGLKQQKQQTTTQLTDLQDTYTKNLEKLEKTLKDSSSQAIKLQDELPEKTENFEKLKEQKKQLAENLTTLNNDLDKLKVELETTRENSTKIQDKLDKANAKLKQSLKATNELSDFNSQLKKEIETVQTTHSDLQNKCNNLEREIKEKNKEINSLNSLIIKITQQLESSKLEVESLNKKNEITEQNGQSLEKQLQDKENSMPIQHAPFEEHLIDLNSSNDDNKNPSGISPIPSQSSNQSPTTFPRSSLYSNDLLRNFSHNATSSMENISHDSGFSDSTSHSSSNFSKLKRSQSLSDLIKYNHIKDNGSHPNNSLSKHLINYDGTRDIEEDEVRTTTPINGAIPMPTQQQDALAQIETGVIDAFIPAYHPAIIKAFTKEFSQIAAQAAKILFNGNIDSELPEFNDKLQKISENEIDSLVSALFKNKSLLACISEKINTEGLGQPTYLEEIKHSAALIFDTLTIKRSNTDDLRYKDYILGRARDLLIKLCVENLQNNEKEHLIKLAKNNLALQANTNGLQTKEYTEIIQKTAEELTTKLLKTGNLQNLLAEKKSLHLGTGVNLLVASQQQLQNQLSHQINHNFDHYFPILHLDPILQKINTGIALSEEEIAKFPLELQYATTLEEFVVGLRAEHPNLLPDYESKINVETFKQLSFILRKNALRALSQVAPEDKDIFDLNTEKWLEKKLLVITKKSFSLKLDRKHQKDLDNKFQKLFLLSPLEAMAITHKSPDELKKELKKLQGLKLDATTRLSKTFAKIEQRLSEYPNLITEDGTFQANLNNSQPLNAPNLSIAQMQILLDKINHHLKNDITKWNLLNNNNKIAVGIATDIISDPTNPFEFDIDTTQTLVSNSLAILYEFHDLQGILDRRKLWNSEIQQLYALAQKLKSSSEFNQEIEDRVSNLKDMLNLKENDADEGIKTFPKAVFLPHKCRIIPNLQFDSSDTEEYHLQAGAFYKQEALKIGKTITFAQKLSNEGECKWSATLSNDKCLSFKTEKKRFRREKSYLHEVSFAQMVYSVNSFKDAKTCTLNFSNCSQNMKEKLYLFAKAYNELRLEDNELQKRPKLTCNLKNPPDLDKTKVAAAKEEIKAQLNLHTHELEDISAKLKDDTMSHQIIRSRGL